MSNPFDRLKPQEILEIPIKRKIVVEFDAIDTPEEIQTSNTLGGPITVKFGVAFSDHIKGVDAETSQSIDKGGIILKVKSIDGQTVSVYYRNWNRREIASFQPDIEDGSIFQYPYELFRAGKGPQFQLQIRRLPKQ